MADEAEFYALLARLEKEIGREAVFAMIERAFLYGERPPGAPEPRGLLQCDVSPSVPPK